MQDKHNQVSRKIRTKKVLDSYFPLSNKDKMLVTSRVRLQMLIFWPEFHTLGVDVCSSLVLDGYTTLAFIITITSWH